jgi:hypothetical protein
MDALSATRQSEMAQTVVLNGATLLEIKSKYAGGDAKIAEAVGELTVQANRWLLDGPWSVLNKDQVPPSGDKHDYLSQAPYFWPTAPRTSENPYGCPYVRRDGERNPDAARIPDRAGALKLFGAAYELALAWYYTRVEAYARHAGGILRAWFVTPDTRMNPNLNHSQFIPRRRSGSSTGIIDFSQGFSSVLDAAAILRAGAPGWHLSDHDAFLKWNDEFLHWLTQGEFGQAESERRNNHGTFFDMQAAAIALAVGDTGAARKLVLDARTKRIDVQISSDGAQPAELARSLSWHYSTFNLVGLTRLASIGENLDVDLWNYTGPDGANLLKAVDFLIPAATQTSVWPFADLNPQWFAASDIIQAAADRGYAPARAAIPGLASPPRGNLYPIRPAAEQLGVTLG